MKKLLALSLVTATALGLTPIASQAAENKSISNLSNGKNFVIVNPSNVNDILCKIEESVGKGNMIKFDCPNLSIADLLNPANCKPDINVPNKPDTDKPDDNVPDKPDTDKPDNNKPDNKPDTNPDNKPDTGSESSFANEVVRLVNEERAKAGLSKLSVNNNVKAAANVRAKEIVQSFSHTRPNGSSFSSVLAENGVKYQGAGENIAWGQKSPEEVMKGWMNSPGHRANILNAKFTTIGVGHYQNGSGTNYWTQLFTY